MRKNVRRARANLGLVVLAAASCSYPRPPPILELVAGTIGESGTADGPGDSARFHTPKGLALDGAGNLYVADRDNHTIRKVAPDGTVTTLAGKADVEGRADGTGVDARFKLPAGVALDSAGNVYVADRDNHAIRKIAPDGTVTTLAGKATGTSAPGNVDGTGDAARFHSPSDVAVDGAGNVYVADQANHTIRKVAPDGTVTTLAGKVVDPPVSGSVDGAGDVARFNTPSGVAVDSAGNVYVADQGNHTIRIISPAGGVGTLAGQPGMSGSVDNTGGAARFSSPSGVAVDSAGNVYVADMDNHTVRMVTRDGTVATLAGAAGMSGSADGSDGAARFSRPAGVAVDGNGLNVYIAEHDNDTIRKVTAARAVTTLAGKPSEPGSADGTGAAARFDQLCGVAVDESGNLYVADEGNHTIRKITESREVTTLAGQAGVSGTADGEAARFHNPCGVAVDGAGNVYIADTRNHTIRRVSPEGFVTRLAGTAGVTGSTNGPAAIAHFEAPSGVAVDRAGNVFVADTGNHTIRKISPEGNVTTLAGSPDMSGSDDGVGAMARFNQPSSVAVDSAGNVYVADQANHTIRKVTAAGEVTTLAGTRGMSGSADDIGTAAQFYYPFSVAVDRAGDVYVTDKQNSTIRKVTPTGTTTTVAGTAGVAGTLLGDSPRFGYPRGLAIVGDTLVITDGNAILRFRYTDP